MISLELARALRDAGLTWTPADGDRFVVPDRDMDDNVFVVSQMTIEVQDRHYGKVLGFNGITEWALDSIEHDEALWLPRESQLRELLAGTFRALDRGERGWRVRTEISGEKLYAHDPDAEQAYGLALLHLLSTLH